MKQAEKAKKTYAVRKGRQPGIYYSWPEAEKQVNGFPGAEYKSFSRESDALNYLKLDPADPQNAVKQEPEYDKKDYSAVIYTGGCLPQAAPARARAAMSKIAIRLLGPT
ncbi:RNase H1/viroplasmin domain-containing protein [Lactobacillus delbrueckii]|uniref:RNase H1/viroplasmin domain-containing protein n=1 Tax=Lactobacillus delbrueckii TaxID=1584 RepID=UPI001E2AD564|nr:RNase H1/viroplasmin domain-containing protein [Lactobacillus delbrueckii]MCD5471175.1 RNase H1/viroplasmin domain-containing protein [Lactobacillus delbrueckii subsp. bulgaricus]